LSAAARQETKMDGTQLQRFKQITLDYFAKLAPGEEPALEAPYLQFGPLTLLDYASLVRISGEYEGCVYLTSPTPVLAQLLAANGEPEVSERTLADMCRELSNVLSGNASASFGAEWRISVPESLGPLDLLDLDLPSSSYVMPFRWRGTTSLLVVGLAERGRRP
jgi:chemotaxis protein CheX